MLDQRLAEVRPADRGGGALALEQRERARRVEDRLGQQARARVHRAEQREDEPAHPEERHRRPDAVVAPYAAELAELVARDARTVPWLWTAPFGSAVLPEL